MMENKAEICRAFLKVLQMTRNCADLVSLDYEIDYWGDEVVVAKYEGGGIKRINVSCDSGTAMISDIIRVIV